MVSLIPPTTVLTPADTANQLRSSGLDAFGVTMPILSGSWSSSGVGVLDEDHLTVSVPFPLKAPFHAIVRYLTDLTPYRDVTGQPINGPVCVLDLHPEAARRLTSLVTQRLGSPLVHPVPVAYVVTGMSWHSGGAPAGSKPPVYLIGAGDTISGDGTSPITVSFHDARGLPIDPVAVAAMFADLYAWLPGLFVGTPSDANGLNAVVNLIDSTAEPVRYHVISPHGVLCTPTADMGLAVQGGASISGSTGTVTLAAGQSLTHTAVSSIYWGFAPGGFLDQVALAPPTLPTRTPAVNLPRQFFRVMAVDLNWHLLGNRTGAAANGVPPDPSSVPANAAQGAVPSPSFTLPLVRPCVPRFTYLTDGMDVLGAAGTITNGVVGAPDFMTLICSPAIDASLAVPPAPGTAAHWPNFPAPNPSTALATGVDLVSLATATWRNPTDAPNAKLDVIVTLKSDARLPAGTHVRVYPRIFQTITSIGEQPSFVRGDGGAAIVPSVGATKVLLTNPFGLAPNDPLPGGPVVVDIVATGRDGTRRRCSQTKITLAGGTESWTGTLIQFGGDAFLNAPAFAVWNQVFGTAAVAPASVFGIPGPPPPSGPTPNDIFTAVQKLANETTAPRIGPHLPTQGRFETIFAVGLSTAADPRFVWQAVLTGGRWIWETRSASPGLGDPGNPAGPDVHAAGVRVGGQLGYDLAFHALKRAQAVLPVGPGHFGWLLVTMGNNWALPAIDATGTVAGVMLETIAPYCDSPELGLIPMPLPTDNLQNAVNQMSQSMGINPPPTINIAQEPLLRQEVQREIQTARAGQHDGMLSLARAIAQAEEYIYIEGPTLSKTALAGDIGIDLVNLIVQRLGAREQLKVLVCVPRLPDFASKKDNWGRAAFKQRNDALLTISGAAPTRVALFSPISFPGRSTAIRSTTVLIDDVYACSGTTHIRRRGLTFDGSVAVASMDRQLDGWGVSASIAAYRQQLVAAKLGVVPPGTPASSTALWTRLARPSSMFSAIAELLADGGQGRCTPVWAGPSDTSVIPQTDELSDPDGLAASESTLLGLYGATILEA